MHRSQQLSLFSVEGIGLLVEHLTSFCKMLVLFSHAGQSWILEAIKLRLSMCYEVGARIIHLHEQKN